MCWLTCGVIKTKSWRSALYSQKNQTAFYFFLLFQFHSVSVDAVASVARQTGRLARLGINISDSDWLTLQCWAGLMTWHHGNTHSQLHHLFIVLSRQCV